MIGEQFAPSCSGGEPRIFILPDFRLAVYDRQVANPVIVAHLSISLGDVKENLS